MDASITHINPAHIAASELPIWSRATSHYNHLWTISNAKEFCKQLLNLAAVPTITAAEYASIAAVANGDMWPVPDTVYTREDWDRDIYINAVAGQEIEESIYWEMFNVMPPLDLPVNERTKYYSAGFLVGEASSIDPVTYRTLYNAYGKRNGHYYFIGLLPSC